MPNDSPNSLLMNAFHAAIVLLGTVVALFLAIQLLEQIWPWLVGIGCTLAALTIALAVWRFRRSRDRW